MQVHTEIFDGRKKKDDAVCPMDCLGRIANWIERRQDQIEVISIVPTGYDSESEFFDQYIVVYRSSQKQR